MRLHEIDLPIGKILNLKIQGLDYKSYQFDVEMIGYVKGKNLMVSVPNKPGQVTLLAGTNVELCAQLPQGSLSFEVEIECINESPFLYLLLEYPRGVEFKRRRCEPRFSVDTPVEVLGHTGMGMKTSPQSGHLLDVSVNGGRVVLEKELTSMITQIDVGLMLSYRKFERDLNLVAKIRNSAPLSDNHSECGFGYGIEFVEINEVDKLFLQAYCLQSELDSKSMLCEPA